MRFYYYFKCLLDMKQKKIHFVICYDSMDLVISTVYLFCSVPFDIGHTQSPEISTELKHPRWLTHIIVGNRNFLKTQCVYSGTLHAAADLRTSNRIE